MSPRRAIPGLLVAIICGALALYLFGNASVGLWDRDEPRYAQTSRQMLQSGDWIVPRLLDEVRTAKPAFIYWCQAASMKLLGDTAFAARFPSVVAMTAVLSLLAIVVYRGVGPRRALWTALVFATSGLVIASAKMCLTDAVLLLWTFLAQLCLYAIYRGDHRLWVTIGLWVAIGLAGLTKGPVVLGVLLVSMLVLAALDAVALGWRRLPSWRAAIAWWPRTRPLMGIFIIALIVGPWLYAIESRQPGFLRQTLGHDVWERTVNSLEGHKGPPGYYLLTIWGTFFPWSLLLLTAITIGWRHRRTPLIRCALAAVFGPWMLMELVQTKLPHYLLPIFPPLALLCGDAIVRCARGEHDDLVRRRFIIMVAAWALIVVVLGAAPLASLAHFPASRQAMWIMIALAVLAVGYGEYVFRQFRQRRIAAGAAGMGIGMAVIVAVAYGLYLPRADYLRLSQRAAETLIAHGATGPGDVISVGYKEPSLVFHQGGTLRPAGDIDYLSHVPYDQWPPFLVLRDDAWERTPVHLRERIEVLEAIEGMAYNDRSNTMTLRIVRKR